MAGKKANGESRQDNQVGIVMILIVLLLVLPVTFGNGTLQVGLDIDGTVSGTIKSWWGLKRESYELKVIDGAWDYRQISESSLFGGTKSMVGEWSEVYFDDQMPDYPEYNPRW